MTHFDQQCFHFKLLGEQLEVRPACLTRQEDHLNLSINKGGGLVVLMADSLLDNAEPLAFSAPGTTDIRASRL